MDERSDGVRSIRENPSGSGAVPLMVHPEWRARFSWCVQGVTHRGDSPPDFDLGLFGEGAEGEVRERWHALAAETGASRVVCSRQVHGAVVHAHPPSTQPGSAAPTLHVADEGDGHLSGAVGDLLAVTIADCVPILLVAPRQRTVSVLHGGWRGLAAGILDAGVRALTNRSGAAPSEIHAHLGPAICGGCYEVGPEVHQALGLPTPAGPTPVDLRGWAAERLVRSGLEGERVTISTWCTRCGESPFFSHRGGDAARQVAFIGVRS